MSEKDTRRKDIMHVLYRDEAPILYAWVGFFNRTPGKESQSHSGSSPYIARLTMGDGEEVVPGSLKFMVEDAYKTVQSILTIDDQYIDALARAGVRIADLEKDEEGNVSARIPDGARSDCLNIGRGLACMLSLLSIQVRNLFDIVPRLEKKPPTFPLTNLATGEQVEEVGMRVLLNHFVHSRYLFIHGDMVVDLFPSKPPEDAPVNQRFMGYGIGWRDLVATVDDMVSAVTVNDLLGVLRGGIRGFSRGTGNGDVVFLVQNMLSLTSILQAKATTDKRYADLLNSISSSMDLSSYLEKYRPKTGEPIQVSVSVGSPHIAVHEEVGKRMVRMNMKCWVRMIGGDGRMIHRGREPESVTLPFDHDEFFNRVGRLFGSDRLLDPR